MQQTSQRKMCSDLKRSVQDKRQKDIDFRKSQLVQQRENQVELIVFHVFMQVGLLVYISQRNRTRDSRKSLLALLAAESWQDSLRATY
jgi:hypothetical protein